MRASSRFRAATSPFPRGTLRLFPSASKVVDKKANEVHLPIVRYGHGFTAEGGLCDALEQTRVSQRFLSLKTFGLQRDGDPDTVAGGLWRRPPSLWHNLFHCHDLAGRG